MTSGYHKMADGCCHKTVTERCSDCAFSAQPPVALLDALTELLNALDEETIDPGKRSAWFKRLGAAKSVARASLFPYRNVE